MFRCVCAAGVVRPATQLTEVTLRYGGFKSTVFERWMILPSGMKNAYRYTLPHRLQKTPVYVGANILLSSN